MKRVLGTSPQTTLWGVVAVIGGVLVSLNTIDGAEQAFNDLFANGATWAKIVGTVMVGIGGTFAFHASRDNNVTSEGANG